MSYDYSERFSNWQVGGAAVQEVSPEPPTKKVDEFNCDSSKADQYYDEDFNINEEYVINYCEQAYENRVMPSDLLDDMANQDWHIKAVFDILDNYYWSNATSIDDEGFRYFVIAMKEMMMCGYSPNASEPEVFMSSDRFGFQDCSDAAEMKTLYRKLARQYHPDLGGSEADMQELNAAYESATAFGSLR